MEGCADWQGETHQERHTACTSVSYLGVDAAGYYGSSDRGRCSVDPALMIMMMINPC